MTTTEQTINLNHNAAQCMKSATGIWESTYHNVCTGTMTSVPHGAFDMIMATIFMLMMVAMLACMIYGIYVLATD